jgi:mannose-6-phosphate isomerase
MFYPLKFQPIPKHRIWGGNKLKSSLNKPFRENKIGESWEISTIPDDISVVSNGVFKGKNLQELIDAYPVEILGKKVVEHYGTNFPLLIKFIDAQSDLSIQLHPNDELALKRHNSLGKEEMWYIMEANQESRLMFGFNQKLDKETYSNHLKNNTLQSVLHYEKVNTGDVFRIPTGRVHAIGSGILLAEIQQNSDVTYRLYDYNRTDEKGNLRELHTELALDAINFDVPTQFKADYDSTKNRSNKVVESKYFTTNLFHLNQKMEFQNSKKSETFTIYICIDGKSIIKNDKFEIVLNKGEIVLIPAIIDQYEIDPQSEVKLLQVFP